MKTQYSIIICTNELNNQHLENMKETICRYQTSGYEGVPPMDVEIVAEVGRELTDKDKSNMRRRLDDIVRDLESEAIANDPQEKRKGELEQNELLALFGKHKIYWEQIPNEYCGEPCCQHKHWLIVTTEMGRIKVGWRKRVIVIDWEDSDLQADAQTIFPDEDVTKADKMIHAWGLEKAQEYIDTLLS